jgi:hypothetical protein
MVKKPSLFMDAKEGLDWMTLRINTAKIVAAASALFLAVLLSLMRSLAQQSPNPNATSGSSASDFDFSIYFAGNVRGNLEPCG